MEVYLGAFCPVVLPKNRQEPRDMNTKLVMFSLALSVLPIASRTPESRLAQAVHPAGGPVEPSAGLNASVVMEQVIDAGSMLTGSVRVSLDSLSSDVSVDL